MSRRGARSGPAARRRRQLTRDAHRTPRKPISVYRVSRSLRNNHVTGYARLRVPVPSFLGATTDVGMSSILGSSRLPGHKRAEVAYGVRRNAKGGQR